MKGSATPASPPLTGGNFDNFIKDEEWNTCNAPTIFRFVCCMLSLAILHSLPPGLSAQLTARQNLK
jgi:hypothetical protein